MARAGTMHPPVTLPDRYRVVRYLARGGMASVWEAEDRLLGRRVAVKVLAEHLAEDVGARERFQREARAAARLSSEQHVVTIYDVSQGEGGGRPFIVMELMPGGTVADRLKERPPTQAEALDWLRQAAEAIDDSHRRRLVHRDIKPANLLLDGRGRLAVTDFGIARLAEDQTMTSTGQVLGTAAYLSPEQACGETATPASDRYAFAVVAYQLLAGEKPFQAEHFAAQARQHIEVAPPPASSVRPELPPGVDAALEQGLAKDPDARWPTAGAMVDALERALDEAPAPRAAPTRRLPPDGAAVPPTSDFPLRPQKRRFARRRSGRGGAAMLGAGAADRRAGAGTAGAAADRRAAAGTPGNGAPAHPAAGTPGTRAPAGERRTGAAARPPERGASTPPPARPAPSSSRPRRRWGVLVIAAVALVALAGAIVALATSSGGGRQLTARVDHATNKRAQSAEKQRAAHRRAASSSSSSSGPQTAPVSQTPQSAPASGSGTGSRSGSGSGAGSGSTSGGDPTALNAQGYQLLQSGNPQQAVPILRRAVNACNGDPSRLTCAYAMYNLAHALRLSGHPSQAVPLLEKRLQNPDQRATVERELALARAGSTSDGSGTSSGSAGGSSSGASAGGGKAGKGQTAGKGNGD